MQSIEAVITVEIPPVGPLLARNSDAAFVVGAEYEVGTDGWCPGDLPLSVPVLCVLSIDNHVPVMPAIRTEVPALAAIQELTVKSSPDSVEETKVAEVTGVAPSCGLTVSATFSGKKVNHTLICVNGKFSIKVTAPARQDGETNTIQIAITHGNSTKFVAVPVFAL